MPEEDYAKINLGDFVQNNSELFVVLGVFSALAIYISQLNGASIDQAPLETRVGFAGSLLLAILVLSLIYKKLLDIAGSLEKLVRAHARLSNLDLVVFTTGISLLVPALGSPLLEYQSALYYLLGTALLLVYLPLLLEAMLEIRLALPENPYLRYAISATMGTLAFHGSSRVVSHIENNPGLVGTAEFSLHNPNPLLIDVAAVGVAILQMVSLGVATFSVIFFLDELTPDQGGEEEQAE